MNTSLYVAWRSNEPSSGRWGPVGRLDHVGAGYRFVYTLGARDMAGFEPFPGMPDVESVYESEELFPVFANRLIARSRPEYEAFLVWGGFDPDNPPDPIAVLGVTEGRRATDSLELFPCPIPDAEGCFVNKFFLHGVRYMPQGALERVNQLHVGESLGVMMDVLNQYDPKAVAVRTCDKQDRFMIGYVPRYLAQDVWQLVGQCDPDYMQLSVERINKDAPLQQRVLCRLHACWPDRFRPCASQEFQPIVGEMTPTA